MKIEGRVTSEAPTGGLGGLVDISSPTNILIAPFSGVPGVLQLDPRDLSTFGADSLLIGGFRQSNSEGAMVTVTTPNIAVDNPGSPLTGPDLILVASQSLTLAAGADLEQEGSLTAPAETLLFGDEMIADSGDGVLLRVASDPAAQLVRSGVSSATVPSLVVGARALITGQSVTLDSTSATSLDPSANVSGNAVALNSGQISLVLSNAGQLNPTTGLYIQGSALENLEATAQALSLLSYSSFDIYGIGQVGNLATTGRPAAASLALHAGGNPRLPTTLVESSRLSRETCSWTILQTVSVPGSSSPSMGTLQFVGDTIRLGENQVDVDQFANLTLAASGGFL